jgi:hypothetical protein
MMMCVCVCVRGRVMEERQFCEDADANRLTGPLLSPLPPSLSPVVRTPMSSARIFISSHKRRHSLRTPLFFLHFLPSSSSSCIMIPPSCASPPAVHNLASFASGTGTSSAPPNIRGCLRQQCVLNGASTLRRTCSSACVLRCVGVLANSAHTHTPLPCATQQTSPCAYSPTHCTFVSFVVACAAVGSRDQCGWELWVQHGDDGVGEVHLRP